MSKREKKPPSREEELHKSDEEFLTIIQFTGWVSFLIGGAILVLLLYLWFVDDNHQLSIAGFEIEISATLTTITLFSITTTAFCFGLVDIIRNDITKKKQYFMKWIIGEFLLAIFGIISLAAYLW